jgi:acetolactate synthase-1/2/3 large subunit
MLLKAKHPVIVTEECRRSTTAVERLIEISELLSIPDVESRTAPYLNFPRTHPLHAGFDSAEILTGTRPTRPASALLPAILKYRR